MRDAGRQESAGLFADDSQEETRQRITDKRAPPKRGEADCGIVGAENMQESKQEGGDDQPRAELDSEHPHRTTEGLVQPRLEIASKGKLLPKP